MICQNLRSKNDTNGNPRRCWVIYADEGGIFDVIDEGYGGKPEACEGLVQIASVDVSPTEYRSFLAITNARR